jgi:hypothetical protein
VIIASSGNQFSVNFLCRVRISLIHQFVSLPLCGGVIPIARHGLL